MTATTQYRDGSYKLIQFDLTFPNGRTQTITSQCARADIYESVLESTVVAEFVLVDKIKMFEAVNFLEEKITIHFTTYEDNDEAGVKYELYPVIVGDPADSLPDGKGTVYKITCVSKEAKRSTQIKNFSFTRQKIESERMIAAMLQDTSPEGLNSQKPIFLEKTRGLHGFNFTLVNPFTAIDEIRLKALSSDFNSHCFVFYENSKGYHFKSFEGLIKDGKTKIGDKYYTQSAATDISIAGAKWRNILAFHLVQSGNQNITRALGAGNVLVKLQNTISRKITEVNLDQRYLNFTQLNDNAQSASLKSQNELGSTISKVQLVSFDPTVETEDIGEIAAVRPYYLSFLFNTIAHITVYGDTTVTVGDVITAKIPEKSALTLGENEPYVDTSTTVAGNYLVTKCRHSLTFGENSLSYLQALEIVKDGYGGNAPTTGNYVAS
jgi:hypothetical protein